MHISSISKETIPVKKYFRKMSEEQKITTFTQAVFNSPEELKLKVVTAENSDSNKIYAEIKENVLIYLSESKCCTSVKPDGVYYTYEESCETKSSNGRKKKATTSKKPKKAPKKVPNQYNSDSDSDTDNNNNNDNTSDNEDTASDKKVKPKVEKKVNSLKIKKKNMITMTTKFKTALRTIVTRFFSEAYRSKYDNDNKTYELNPEKPKISGDNYMLDIIFSIVEKHCVGSRVSIIGSFTKTESVLKKACTEYLKRKHFNNQDSIRCVETMKKFIQLLSLDIAHTLTAGRQGLSDTLVKSIVISKYMETETPDNDHLFNFITLCDSMVESVMNINTEKAKLSKEKRELENKNNSSDNDNNETKDSTKKSSPKKNAKSNKKTTSTKKSSASDDNDNDDDDNNDDESKKISKPKSSTNAKKSSSKKNAKSNKKSTVRKPLASDDEDDNDEDDNDDDEDEDEDSDSDVSD